MGTRSARGVPSSAGTAGLRLRRARRGGFHQHSYCPCPGPGMRFPLRVTAMLKNERGNVCFALLFFVGFFFFSLPLKDTHLCLIKLFQSDNERDWLLPTR